MFSFHKIMSKSFFITNKFLFKNIENLNLLGLFVACHLTYAMSTRKKNEIIIKKKYNFTRNGFTEFMIVDNKGKHYNVNNSFWYWKWNSIEDWNKMEINQKININYYDFRIPILGLFPNIYNSIF